MRTYFDSSTLLKRYIEEPGSDQVRQKWIEATEVIVSALCAPEVVSAFVRLKREKKLNEETYRLLKRHFILDMGQASVEAIDDETLRESIRCLEKTGIKASDAVHLATALRTDCELFLSADIRQQEAARVMGLKVEAV